MKKVLELTGTLKHDIYDDEYYHEIHQKDGIEVRLMRWSKVDLCRIGLDELRQYEGKKITVKVFVD